MERRQVEIILTVLFVAFCYGWLWFWAAAAGLLAAAAVRRGRRWWASEQQRRAAIVERADREHAQVLAGDPRGVHGHWPPADLT